MDAEREPLPISALILAHNEARRLESLLPALDFVREIVVVDSGSTDGTPGVAARLGARVSTRALDGFGPQRQFALAQCREEWVLWIDADEWLDAAAVAAIRAALAGAGASRGPAGYRLARRTWFLGRRIRFCGWRGERLPRLFRRRSARFDDAIVHETVLIDGVLADLPGVLEHHSYERWADCREKLMRYATAGAARARAEGRRAGVLDVALRPPLRFLQMYLLQGGFLDGVHGLLVCGLGATHVFLKYAELWAEPGPGRGAPRSRP